jgi:hypothetical protein
MITRNSLIQSEAILVPYKPFVTLLNTLSYESLECKDAKRVENVATLLLHYFSSLIIGEGKKNAQKCHCEIR